MKKTFHLRPAGKNPDRVLESIKHDIRKYLQRERHKPLPAGADFWAFDCRFGADEAHAESIHSSAIRDCVSAAASEGRDSFYLEILARPTARDVIGSTSQGEAAHDTDPA